MGTMNLIILRRRLLEKGMTEKEIDKLIESTKHLSNSDFEFFLRSLGINLDVVLDEVNIEQEKPD